MTYKQNKLLDEALKILRYNKNDVPISDTANRRLAVVFIQATAKTMGLTYEITQALLDILVENGHAKPDDGGYEITPRGRLFNDNEGYVKNKRISDFQKGWLLFQAVVLAASALGLVFFEGWKVYHHLTWE